MHVQRDCHCASLGVNMHALLAQPALVFLFGWCTCQGGSGIDLYVSNASGYAFQMVPSVLNAPSLPLVT